MKKIILVLSTIMLLFSACNKQTIETSNDITLNELAQQYPKLTEATEQVNPLKVGIPLPVQGDGLYLQFHSSTGGIMYVPMTVDNVGGFGSGFFIVASAGNNHKITILSSYDILEIKTGTCQAYPSYDMKTLKASAYFQSTLSQNGYYDTNNHYHCCANGIYDINDPSCNIGVQTCPLVEQKLVLAKTTNGKVMLVGW